MYTAMRRINNTAIKLTTQPAIFYHYRPSSLRAFASKSPSGTSAEPVSKDENPAQETGRIISDDGADSRGRTGGGEQLKSTAPGAPEPPKVSSFSLPDAKEDQKLSKEEKKEVEEHNRQFYETHEKVKDNNGSGQKA